MWQNFLEATWDRFVLSIIILFCQFGKKKKLFPGRDRFMAVKASYIASGLTTRIHGNTKCLPYNSLTFEETKNVVRFINSYAEQHAILLPGRVPGYKRDNLQLLPSSTTKKVFPKDIYGTLYSIFTLTSQRLCGLTTS